MNRRDNLNMKRLIMIGAAMMVATAGVIAAMATQPTNAPEGWTNAAPRDEIRPTFSFDPKGGPAGAGALVTKSDTREGLFGWWSKSIPVEGTKFYRFTAERKVESDKSPRRTGVARVVWQDEKGQTVDRDE